MATRMARPRGAWRQSSSAGFAGSGGPPPRGPPETSVIRWKGKIGAVAPSVRAGEGQVRAEPMLPSANETPTPATAAGEM